MTPAVSDLLGPGAMLALAVLVLGVGPLVFGASRRAPWLLTGIDGFVLASVGALSAIFVLPEAVRSAGLLAVVAAIGGLALPTLVERLSGQHRVVHAVGLSVALVGLVAHTLVDGVALSAPHGDGLTLVVAIVLHRIPVGLVAWWLVRPAWGTARAVLVLLLIGVGTVLGFAFGESQLAHLEGTGLGMFQAFIAGTLLHVVVHRTVHVTRTVTRSPLAETVGALLGVLIVALVPHTEHAEGAHLAGYGHRFLDLALDTAPALLLGYLLAGTLKVALPRARIGWLLRGGALSQAARGMAFGIPIPICSCGVVPAYQGLVRRGVPAAAGMAFLVATPELGVESLLLSLPLLGGELTVARLVAAVLVALVVGVVVGSRVAPQAPADAAAEETAPASWAERGRQALRFGFGEVADETAAWILVGLAVAAAIEPDALTGFFASFPSGADVVVAAFIGLPTYVCASGATPLAAALLLAGISPGAAVAFLLAGPATNVTTFGVLSRLHGPTIALAFGACVMGCAIALGVAVNTFVDPLSVPALAEQHGHASVIAWAALGVMTLVYAAALLRQGPRAFVENVLSFGGGDHDHDHDHDHGHDHDHDHDVPGHGHSHEGESCGC